MARRCLPGSANYQPGCQRRADDSRAHQPVACSASYRIANCRTDVVSGGWSLVWKGWQQAGNPCKMHLVCIISMIQIIAAWTLYERDDLLRAAIRLYPGDSEERTGELFPRSDCMDDAQHPDETGARPSWTCCACLAVLRAENASPSTLPHPGRPVRQDGWRYQEGHRFAIVSRTLQRFNGGKFTNRTGT